MSQLLVSKYLNDLEVYRRVSGTNRETVVREAFKTLLREWGKSSGLVLITEWEHEIQLGRDQISQARRVCTRC